MGHFSNKIFHHINMFARASVCHGPNVRCTLVRFVIPSLVPFQMFMKQNLFKFSLTSSLPPERYFFNDLKLIVYFYQLTYISNTSALVLNSSF